MKIESMKEVQLRKARNIFLFDCRVLGLDLQILHAYRDVLGSFVHFTGNILVKDLTPDHLRLYIANLFDGPSEGEEHTSMVVSHYAIIDEWIRWLYAQEFVMQRGSSITPPNLNNLSLRSRRILPYCA
jgi:hypothetical protein